MTTLCNCEIIDGKVVNACKAHCEWAEAMINKPEENPEIDALLQELSRRIDNQLYKGIGLGLVAIALSVVHFTDKLEERLKSGISIY